MKQSLVCKWTRWRRNHWRLMYNCERTCTHTGRPSRGYWLSIVCSRPNWDSWGVGVWFGIRRYVWRRSVRTWEYRYLLAYRIWCTITVGHPFRSVQPFFLFVVYGLYAAATEGVIKAWITNLSHKENTATAIGFYTSCESVCALFASIIAGALWTNFGSNSTFITTAVISLLVFIYFLLRIRNSATQ